MKTKLVLIFILVGLILSSCSGTYIEQGKFKGTVTGVEKINDATVRVDFLVIGDDRLDGNEASHYFIAIVDPSLSTVAYESKVLVQCYFYNKSSANFRGNIHSNSCQFLEVFF